MSKINFDESIPESTVNEICDILIDLRSLCESEEEFISILNDLAEDKKKGKKE